MDEKDAAELREREDIAASLKELTRYISVAGGSVAEVSLACAWTESGLRCRCNEEHGRGRKGFEVCNKKA